MKLFDIFNTKKIGIDLGTSNSLVYITGKEIILNEPSIVALSSDDQSIVAVGAKAREMIGKTPEAIVAKKPLKEGVIADYPITQAMLRYFIGVTTRKIRFNKVDVVIAVSSGITSTERRAVIRATKNAGARDIFIVKKPILAAVGAGVPIDSSTGSMVIDIGGGTTEVAIISLGGIVVSESAKIGGDRMDASIVSYIKNKYNIAIGDSTAEKIKNNIGSAVPLKDNPSIEVFGLDMMTGLPKNIEVQNQDVYEAIQEDVREIVLTVKKVLRETPPELVSDIIDRGMLLAGGVAHLQQMDVLLGESVGISVFVVEDPMLCVVRGTGIAIDNIEAYKNLKMIKPA